MSPAAKSRPIRRTLLDVTGSTTLAGNSTIDVANNGTGVGTVQLDDVSGGNFSLTKTGEGTLALSGTLGFAVLNANEGTTEINADQTLAALNIGANGSRGARRQRPSPAGVRRGNCRGHRASRARARQRHLASQRPQRPDSAGAHRRALPPQPVNPRPDASRRESGAARS